MDIIAVSETWFNSLTSPADTSLVGFQAPFRRDRADTKRGGEPHARASTASWMTYSMVKKALDESIPW